MDGNDNIIDAEKEFEILALKQENKKLKNQLTKYQVLLKEIEDEADPNMITDVEVICISEINKLKEYSGQRELTTDEIKNLDILHKNLKIVRGENPRTKSQGNTKAMSTEEMTKLVKK